VDCRAADGFHAVHGPGPAPSDRNNDVSVT
jgi:hypothetical protein